MGRSLEQEHHDGLPTDVTPSLIPPNLPNNLLDYRRTCDKRSFVYEDICISAFAEMHPYGVILGPHLVDASIGSVSPYSGLPRPDAMLFLIDERNDTWTLERLGEFKCGERTRSTTKLEGFAVLLQAFRDNPLTLPSIMHEFVGDHIPVPSTILVPPNPQITVIFMNTKQGGTIYTNGTEFNATHVPVPMTHKQVRELTGKKRLKD